jgi:hypothetical protein
MRVHVWAAIAGVLGIVGAVLAILTIQPGESVIFAAAIWSVAILLAVVGLYSAWAIPGGKM